MSGRPCNSGWGRTRRRRIPADRLAATWYFRLSRSRRQSRKPRRPPNHRRRHQLRRRLQYLLRKEARLSLRLCRRQQRLRRLPLTAPNRRHRLCLRPRRRQRRRPVARRPRAVLLRREPGLYFCGVLRYRGSTHGGCSSVWLEHLAVAQVVAGSNPVTHPNFFALQPRR